MHRVETTTVKYDAPMWITDPAGQLRPRAIDDIVAQGGWTITDKHITKDGEITYILERPAALGVLFDILSSLDYEASVQFKLVYGDGPERKEPEECPYCKNPDTKDMQHEYKCPYGTIMRLRSKLQRKLEGLVYGRLRD